MQMNIEKQLEALKADKEVKEKLQKEIERFKDHAGRKPGEPMCSGPTSRPCWNFRGRKCRRTTTISAMQKQILNEDHYGLEKVKERILEYLAVRTLTKKGNKPDYLSGGTAGNGKNLHCPLCSQGPE